MFRLICVTGLMTLVPHGLLAQISGEARPVVEAALKAAGGEARLTNLKAAEWKTQGTGHFTGKPMPSSSTLIGQLPDCFRRESESMVDGEKRLRVYIVNGNQGWSKDGATIKSLTDQELLAERDTYHHKRVALTLIPLKDKDIGVELAGDDRVDGKPTSVLVVKKKGFHDIKLYVDKASHLVLKSEGMAVDSRTGKETKLEHYYSLHKNFDGIQYPVKTVTLRDGKLMLEIETIEFRPLSQIDPKRFQP
ncbi:MAG TPA: hypothetical protein PLN21_08595 [Gemmatales bacterium]|nr:hypothetical protein [Gemmatales bacterium]